MPLDNGDEVAFGMAVIPARLPNLERSLPLLLGQCDRVFLHLNGAASWPAWIRDQPRVVLSQTEENRGDAMKFAGLPRVNGYYLSVDDDILYPADYASRLIAALQHRRDQALVCVHGAIFNPLLPCAGVQRRLVYINFKAANPTVRRVLIPGTGTLAVHTRTLSFGPEACVFHNNADLAVGCEAARRGLPVYALDHDAPWLQPLPSGGTVIQASPAAMRELDQALAACQPMFVPAFKEIVGGEETDAAGWARRLVPRVSAVVRAGLVSSDLADTLASVAGQDYPNLEVLVVAGPGAGADTPAVVTSLAPRRPVTLMTVPPAAPVTPGALRNAGVRRAGADWVLHADAGDRWSPHHVSALVTLMQVFPGAGAWATAAARAPRPASAPSGLWASRPPVLPPIPLACVLYRRRDFNGLGGFNEALTSGEDADFVARLARSAPVSVLPRPTVAVAVPLPVD